MTPAGERLQKYIARCGYCSRRKAELLMLHGLVEVDGRPAGDLGVRVDPGSSRVTILGEEILPPEPLTILLNKPAGFITSTHDTHERLTVMDLLPRPVRARGVLPAGRLDLDTEGLLILTNDGDLQHRITHPRYHREKEYRATLDRRPRPRDLDRLRAGVYLADVCRSTQPASVELERSPRRGPWVARVVISEGMKRQVRRMFEVIDVEVVHLERLRIGSLLLGDLERGAYRELSEDEVRELRGHGED